MASETPLLESLPHHSSHSSQQRNEKGELRRTLLRVEERFIICWGQRLSPPLLPSLSHIHSLGTRTHPRVGAPGRQGQPQGLLGKDLDFLLGQKETRKVISSIVLCPGSSGINPMGIDGNLPLEKEISDS